MKTFRHMLVLMVALSASASWAANPPHYLSVPHWKCCVDTILHATYKSICLPKARPSTCPLESWQEVRKDQALTRCSAKAAQ